MQTAEILTTKDLHIFLAKACLGLGTIYFSLAYSLRVKGTSERRWLYKEEILNL